MKNLIIIALAVLLVGCKENNVEPKSEIEQTNNVIPVTISEVEAVNNPILIKSTGLIKASSTTKYSFKIGGVIDNIYADEGDRIKKGQLLASLRLNEIDAQYQQAELGLAKARRDLERVENLYRDSIATLEDYQNVQTQLEILEQTKDQVEFNKEYAKIYASNSGYIITKLGNPGEVIGPGTPVLISNDATRYKGYVLECSVNDYQWTQINVGDSCSIELDAYPNEIIPGRLTSKSAQADPVSGAFRVEMSLSLRNKALATGMFGKVVIHTKNITSSIAVPYEALVQANGKSGYVYTPKPNDKVAQIPVEIGSISKNKVLISKGLAPGDKVVIGNSAFLSPKSNIKIID